MKRFYPVPSHFREPLKHEMELGGKLSGNVQHLEDVKRRLGKSLVEAGGGLLEDEISGSNSPSCRSALIFVPAIAMYGLLIILTVVGKYTVMGQKICNFSFRKLSHHYGQSHLSLDTMGSHV